MKTKGGDPRLKSQYDFLLRIGHKSIDLTAYTESNQFGQRAKQFTEASDQCKKEALQLMFEDLLAIEKEKIHRRELAADERV